MFVQIDGKDFEVESAQHAQALLDQAKALARRIAPDIAEQRLRVHLRTRPQQRPKVEKPIIVTSSPALHEVVNTARQAIFAIYKEAFRDAEIRLRMEAKLRDDEADDEDLMMLL